MTSGAGWTWRFLDGWRDLLPAILGEDSPSSSPSSSSLSSSSADCPSPPSSASFEASFSTAASSASMVSSSSGLSSVSSTASADSSSATVESTLPSSSPASGFSDCSSAAADAGASASSSTSSTLAGRTKRCWCQNSMPSMTMLCSVCLLRNIVRISMYFSTSRLVMSLFGTFRSVATKFVLMGITGLFVGRVVVGNIVGGNDEVGSTVGLLVGMMGAGVTPGIGAAVVGASVVGCRLGSAVAGDFVGGGTVGVPVGTRGQGRLLRSP